MKIHTVIIIGVVFFTTLYASAQDEISPHRKQAIDSLALEKVRDLSKYISLIGDKTTDFFRSHPCN